MSVRDTTCAANHPMLFLTSSWYELAPYALAALVSTLSVRTLIAMTRHSESAPRTAPMDRTA